MTSKAWFNQDHELTPGRELLRSDRSFEISAYTASHRQLLLRSSPRFDTPDPDQETTIDVLFKPVEALRLRESVSGLVIRCATGDEASQVRESLPELRWDGLHVLMLESQGRADYIVCLAVGWEEGVLPRMQQSFFNAIGPGDRWPTNPLFGVGAGFEVATAQELVDALAQEDRPSTRRERYRTVYVLMVKPESRGAYAAGVFLSEEDAEETRLMFAETIHDCWIDYAPVAM